VFTGLKGDERLNRVGIVGLGSGALCCYADEGQHWTYFEIDRAVQHIACETGLFTYYQACPAKCDVVLGDARQTLANTDERFGVLVIDAFSSDAVPVHLLTREALNLYRRRLTPDGILAFNISNRYIDLETVLGDQARNADPPLVCLTQVDVALSDAEKEAGKAPSVWAIMARDRETLDKAVGEGGRWREARRGNAAVWSDDFSNMLGVLKLGGFQPK
jgi:SAM-dependent methyltransferase